MDDRFHCSAARVQCALAGCEKTIVTRWNLDVPHVWNKRSTQRRIAERDRRDEREGRNEVEIQSVRVAPFSHVSHFTRHSPWLLADLFSILLEEERRGDDERLDLSRRGHHGGSRHSVLHLVATPGRRHLRGPGDDPVFIMSRLLSNGLSSLTAQRLSLWSSRDT